MGSKKVQIAIFQISVYLLNKGDYNMFKEIKNSTCVKRVVSQVLQAITKGKLNPGDKLSSERESAKQFKISRPVLREGISTLSFLGIIQRKQGRGNYVSDNLNRTIINKKERI